MLCLNFLCLLLQVVLLPFLNEERLFEAIEGKDESFTEEEKERNEFGHEIVLVNKNHPLALDAAPLGSLYIPSSLQCADKEEKVTINHERTSMFGFLSKSKYSAANDAYIPSPIQGYPDLHNHKAVVYRYAYLNYLLFFKLTSFTDMTCLYSLDIPPLTSSEVD